MGCVEVVVPLYPIRVASCLVPGMIVMILMSVNSVLMCVLSFDRLIKKMNNKRKLEQEDSQSIVLMSRLTKTDRGQLMPCGASFHQSSAKNYPQFLLMMKLLHDCDEDYGMFNLDPLKKGQNSAKFFSIWISHFRPDFGRFCAFFFVIFSDLL